jgi:hypothetical protein
MKTLKKGSEKYNKIRDLYLGSLWHFCYELLGFRDINNDFHKEELAAFDKNRRKGEKGYIALWPRGHLKSSLFTIGDSIRSICKNPDIRILILNATSGNAEGFLGAIGNNILYNEKLNFFFPEIRPLPEKKTVWNTKEIVVNRLNQSLPEPTVAALGIDSNIVSQHYDMIKYDDIVNWDNTGTPEKIGSLKAKYEYTLSVLEPNGIQDMVGTRYDYYDLYNELLENGFYESSVRQLKERNSKTKQDEYIFPQKFNEKVENKIKGQMRFFIFSCQYYNKPVEDEKRLFTKKDVQHYKALPPNGVFRITIDPASSTESYADKSAIVCCYWIGTTSDYPFGGVFLYKYVYERLATYDLLDQMFGMYSEIRPEVMSVEIAGSQSGTLWELIIKEKEKRGFDEINLLKYVPPTKVSKYSRIASMQPYFKRKSVFIKEEHIEFAEELTKYTGYKRKEKDDLIDAMAQQFQIGEFPNLEDDDDDEDDYRPLYGPRSSTRY